MRRCSMSATTGRCLSAPSVMLDGLNCPQDFAVDFSRNLIFILQYGGGGGPKPGSRAAARVASRDSR